MISLLFFSLIQEVESTSPAAVHSVIFFSLIRKVQTSPDAVFNINKGFMSPRSSVGEAKEASTQSNFNLVSWTESLQAFKDSFMVQTETKVCVNGNCAQQGMHGSLRGNKAAPQNDTNPEEVVEVTPAVTVNDPKAIDVETMLAVPLKAMDVSKDVSLDPESFDAQMSVAVEHGPLCPGGNCAHSFVSHGDEGHTVIDSLANDEDQIITNEEIVEMKEKAKEETPDGEF